MNANTIYIENLTHRFSRSKTALDSITLDIGPGMFGLIGPNGAGKTTLMRILTGLLKPTAGLVTVFGHNMHTHNGRQAAKALLGYLPQEVGFYPQLTAREFLDYMAILKGINDIAERRAQVNAALDDVRLQETANQRLKTYSGGMKRRVGIAQALLGQPRFLVVDEPTVGLDPEERVRFRSLLSRLAQDRTVLLSTHIIADIGQSCGDLAVLNQGRVIYRGSPVDLITQAADQAWLVPADGIPPLDSHTLVATLQNGTETHYRLIGHGAPTANAQPTAPDLEDAYIALMRRERADAAIK